ncbi:MAG: electron transfer flavoprotein subunit beta/FixA family protein [Candidatus Kapaibacteriota bacterium]|jgi:electron transfer flavoprotein beta subunit
MNILVCISRVPDTATKINISSNGKAIDNAGVKYILNPYDEFTIEEGLRLKEKNGGTVAALTIGGDSNVDILRTALAMEVDTAIHVKSTRDDFDSMFVAQNIAEVAKSLNPDIILFGKQSIDFDSYQVASLTSELLGLPSVSVVSKLDINGTSVTAERDIEGGKEVLSTSLPCVISVQKGINEPRYPKLPQIMKAKSKPIDTRNAVDNGNYTEVLSMEIPSKARAGKVLGSTDSDLQELVRLLHEDAKVI